MRIKESLHEKRLKRFIESNELMYQRMKIEEKFNS